MIALLSGGNKRWADTYLTTVMPIGRRDVPVVDLRRHPNATVIIDSQARTFPKETIVYQDKVSGQFLKTEVNMSAQPSADRNERSHQVIVYLIHGFATRAWKSILALANTISRRSGREYIFVDVARRSKIDNTDAWRATGLSDEEIYMWQTALHLQAVIEHFTKLGHPGAIVTHSIANELVRHILRNLKSKISITGKQQNQLLQFMDENIGNMPIILVNPFFVRHNFRAALGVMQIFLKSTLPAWLYWPWKFFFASIPANLEQRLDKPIGLLIRPFIYYLAAVAPMVARMPRMGPSLRKLIVKQVAGMPEIAPEFLEDIITEFIQMPFDVLIPELSAVMATAAGDDEERIILENIKNHSVKIKVYFDQNDFIARIGPETQEQYKGVEVVFEDVTKKGISPVLAHKYPFLDPEKFVRGVIKFVGENLPASSPVDTLTFVASSGVENQNLLLLLKIKIMRESLYEFFREATESEINQLKRLMMILPAVWDAVNKAVYPLADNYDLGPVKKPLGISQLLNRKNQDLAVLLPDLPADKVIVSRDEERLSVRILSTENSLSRKSLRKDMGLLSKLLLIETAIILAPAIISIAAGVLSNWYLGVAVYLGMLWVGRRLIAVSIKELYLVWKPRNHAELFDLEIQFDYASQYVYLGHGRMHRDPIVAIFQNNGISPQVASAAKDWLQKHWFLEQLIPWLSSLQNKLGKYAFNYFVVQNVLERSRVMFENLGFRVIQHAEGDAPIAVYHLKAFRQRQAKASDTTASSSVDEQDFSLYYELARKLLDASAYEKFMAIEVFYGPDRYEISRDTVYSIIKILREAPMVEEVYGIGYPFYGAVDVRLRIHQTLSRLQNNEFTQEGFLKRITPDFDMLLVVDHSDKGPWRIQEDMDALLKERFVEYELKYLSLWKKINRILGEKVNAADLYLDKEQALELLLQQGRYSIDFVFVPVHVWNNMPVFVLPGDENRFKFIRDLLFSLDNHEGNRSIVPQEFLQNYVLNVLAPEPKTTDELFSEILMTQPHHQLLALYEKSRRIVIQKFERALMQARFKGLIAAREDGKLGLTEKGEKYYQLVLQYREKLLRFGYGFEGDSFVGQIPAIEAKLSVSSAAIIIPQDQVLRFAGLHRDIDIDNFEFADQVGKLRYVVGKNGYVFFVRQANFQNHQLFRLTFRLTEINPYIGFFGQEIVDEQENFVNAAIDPARQIASLGAGDVLDIQINELYRSLGGLGSVFLSLLIEELYARQIKTLKVYGPTVPAFYRNLGLSWVVVSKRAMILEILHKQEQLYPWQIQAVAAKRGWIVLEALDSGDFKLIVHPLTSNIAFALEKDRLLADSAVASSSSALQLLPPENLEKAQRVVELLQGFGAEPSTIAAAWLAYIPDAQLGTLSSLKKRSRQKDLAPDVARAQHFKRISNIVYIPSVGTDNRLKDLRGLERWLTYFVKVIDDGQSFLFAVADLMAALEQAKDGVQSQKEYLAQKAMHIFVTFANYFGLHEMARDLRVLSLRIVDPDLYQRISEFIDAIDGDLDAGTKDNYLLKIKDGLKQDFENKGVSQETKYRFRAKDPMSFANVVDRKGKKPTEVNDLNGIMVIAITQEERDKAGEILYALTDFNVSPHLQYYDFDMHAPPKVQYEALQFKLKDNKLRPFDIIVFDEKNYDLYLAAVSAAHWEYSARKIEALRQQKLDRFPHFKPSGNLDVDFGQLKDYFADTNAVIFVKPIKNTGTLSGDEHYELTPYVLLKAAIAADVAAQWRSDLLNGHYRGAYPVSLGLYFDENSLILDARKDHQKLKETKNLPVGGILMFSKNGSNVSVNLGKIFVQATTTRARLVSRLIDLTDQEQKKLVEQGRIRLTEIAHLTGRRQEKEALKRLSNALGFKTTDGMEELYQSFALGLVDANSVHEAWSALGRKLLAREMGMAWIMDFDEERIQTRLESILGTFSKLPLKYISTVEMLVEAVGRGRIEPSVIKEKLSAGGVTAKWQITESQYVLRVLIKHDRPGIYLSLTRILANYGINIRRIKDAGADVDIEVDALKDAEILKKVVVDIQNLIPDVSPDSGIFSTLLEVFANRMKIEVRMANTPGEIYRLLKAISEFDRRIKYSSLTITSAINYASVSMTLELPVEICKDSQVYREKILSIIEYVAGNSAREINGPISSSAITEQKLDLRAESIRQRYANGLARRAIFQYADRTFDSSRLVNNLKFHENGEPKSFMGLTVIVRMPEDLIERLSKFQNTIARELQVDGNNQSVSWLVPSSFHMTLVDIDPSAQFADCSSLGVTTEQFALRFEQIKSAFEELPLMDPIRGHVKGVGLRGALTALVHFENIEELRKILIIEKIIQNHAQSYKRNFLSMAGHVSMAYVVQVPRHYESFLKTLREHENQDFGSFEISLVEFTYFPHMSQYDTILTHNLVTGETLKTNMVFSSSAIIEDDMQSEKTLSSFANRASLGVDVKALRNIELVHQKELRRKYLERRALVVWPRGHQRKMRERRRYLAMNRPGVAQGNKASAIESLLKTDRLMEPARFISPFVGKASKSTKVMRQKDILKGISLREESLPKSAVVNPREIMDVNFSYQLPTLQRYLVPETIYFNFTAPVFGVNILLNSLVQNINGQYQIKRLIRAVLISYRKIEYYKHLVIRYYKSTPHNSLGARFREWLVFYQANRGYSGSSEIANDRATPERDFSEYVVVFNFVILLVNVQPG